MFYINIVNKLLSLIQRLKKDYNYYVDRRNNRENC